MGVSSSELVRTIRKHDQNKMIRGENISFRNPNCDHQTNCTIQGVNDLALICHTCNQWHILPACWFTPSPIYMDIQ